MPINILNQAVEKQELIDTLVRHELGMPQPVRLYMICIYVYTYVIGLMGALVYLYVNMDR